MKIKTAETLKCNNCLAVSDLKYCQAYDFCAEQPAPAPSDEGPVNQEGVFFSGSVSFGGSETITLITLTIADLNLV